MVSATEVGHGPRVPPEGPRFGLATATFVVVSSMIGTGVLTTSGFTVYFVGSNQLMLALWVVGGVLALCGAPDAVRALRRTAALRRRLRLPVRSVRPARGFLVGLGLVSDRLRRADRGFGFRGGEIPTGSASAGRRSGGDCAAGCSLRGDRRAGRGSLPGPRLDHPGAGRHDRAEDPILVVLAVVGLAAGWGRWENLADRPPLTSSLIVSMASSLVYISYAYTGWNGASYLAGEIDRPQERMPRAILLGTGLVLVLYLALNTAYALALSAADVRAMVGGPEK